MISEHKDLYNNNEKPEMMVYNEELEEGEIPILQTRPITPNKISQRKRSKSKGKEQKKKTKHEKLEGIKEKEISLPHKGVAKAPINQPLPLPNEQNLSKGQRRRLRKRLNKEKEQQLKNENNQPLTNQTNILVIQNTSINNINKEKKGAPKITRSQLMAKACKKSSKHNSESESETDNVYWNRKKVHTEFPQKDNAKINDENLEKKEVSLIQNINKEENDARKFSPSQLMALKIDINDSEYSSEPESETEYVYWHRKKIHTEFQQKDKTKIIDENLEKKEVGFKTELLQDIYNVEHQETHARARNMRRNNDKAKIEPSVGKTSLSKQAESKENEKKELVKYPCKFYIAYGQCEDVDCRCVHAPLTSEIEYQNFVTENEQFFVQVVKEAPIHNMNHLLRKVLSERYPSFAHSQPHHKYYQNNHTTNLSKPPAFTAQPYNPYSPNQTIHAQYPNYYTHSFPQLAQTSYLPPNLYAKPIFQNNGHHQIPLNFHIRPSMNQESLNFQASKTIENIEIKHILPSIDQIQPLSTFHSKVNSSQSSEKFKSTMEVINEGNFVKENNVALNERKIDATVERIAKLVELSKSRQINKEKIRKNNENLKNNFDPNYNEQKNQLDAQEKITNKNKLESPKKEETSQEEKKEINEEGQDIKSKLDHDSNNSVLLKKLKDSLHLNGEHPMDVKDLVNLYLKLYKK